MSGENTKNYREQGGDTWVVGGVLNVVGTGEIRKDGVAINLASQAAAQANSAASDVAGIVTDFNELLAKLRSAGIINT